MDTENTQAPKRRGRPPKGRTPPPPVDLPAPSENVSYQLTQEGGRTVSVKGIVTPKTVVSRGIVSPVTGRPAKFTKTYAPKPPVSIRLQAPEGDYGKDVPVKKTNTFGMPRLEGSVLTNDLKNIRSSPVQGLTKAP